MIEQKHIMTKKMLIATMMGNALEYYDFTLYGFFAAYLSPLYFPSADPFVSKIASFGALAAGFFMRPLGGLLFGHLGDRYGRKPALLISVVLMTLPTLTIGLLPTYAQIGFWAPLMVIICRLVQGVCTAGEYTGASILTAEFTEKKGPGFACSLLPASSLIGAVTGTLLGALCLLESMPHEAWRIPFIMGFFFGLLGLYLRRELKESPQFVEIKKDQHVSRSPLIDVIKSQKRNLLCSMGIGAATLAPFYIISVYINGLTTQLSLSPSQSMFLNVGMLCLWGILLPMMGYFSDKMGLRKMMSLGACLVGLIGFPIFSYLTHDLSLEKILFCQFVLSVCGAMYVAPSGAFLATQFFPASQRYSGIALGSSCGEALFGGTAPLIATLLVALTGSAHVPGFYLMFCGIIGWVAVNVYKPAAKTSDTLQMVHSIPVSKYIGGPSFHKNSQYIRGLAKKVRFF